MARNRVVVTLKERDAARFPDFLVERALVLADLCARGVVDECAARLKIRWQGGYSVLDVWLMLVLFLAAAANEVIKPFWKKVRAHVANVAALARRLRLPSSASMSRALDAVELDLLRQATPWMLTEAPRVDEVLNHPSMLTYDANGDGHHVFDLDPTVKTLRHRGLPAAMT